MIIKEIKAKKIKDSRKKDTIEILVKTNQGNGTGAAPSGASKSKKEVIDFPNNDVDAAVLFVNTILNQEFKDYEINYFEDFKKVEELIKKYDETERFEKIGGNTIIAFEFALLQALSKGNIWNYLRPEAKGLPRPLGNCIGGGKHVELQNKCEFQEFLLLSLEAKSFSEAVKANQEIYKILRNQFKKVNLTDEGALALELSIEEILDLLTKITNDYYEKNKIRVRIGIDIAADSFFDGKYYIYRNKKLTRDQQIKYIISLVDKYDLCYIEDPLEENDFKGFKTITRQVKKNCLVCGDDLIATNPKLLKKAIDNESITAVIVKPNQIGSLIKTKEVITLAKENKIYPIISHRSGETMDRIISQLAVAFNCPVIKCGIFGKEREAKIEELKKIEKEIKRNK
ncbi:MAG: hypothetical protein PHF86_06845 [Candidatus Nanoarchaeia archaeon]|nr:hypothetical protein [Candidatus Nanoarchaeia archaeon]